MEIPKPHVAILTSPGMGHMIPIIELGKRIIAVRGFPVTLLIPTTQASTAQSNLLQSLTVPKGLSIIELPPADVSGLIHADAAIETRTSIIVKQSLPALHSTIINMVPQPRILIADIFGTDSFEIADEVGMLKYVFVTTTATFTALMMYLPTLHKEVEGEYSDLKEPIQIPGCKPIQIENLVEPLLDRKNDRYTWMLHQASRYSMANGILVNTCEQLEPKSITALRNDPVLLSLPTPPVYAIGPLTRTADSLVSENKCLNWLNKQPSGSVLFVLFGSGGTLSAEQIHELAYGLELSQHRFLWVVRPPSKKDASAVYFTAGGSGGEPSDYLPHGFLNRTRGIGLVVPSWAPQMEILSHASIGGFLSHCGWNSVLESIVNSVPMIAWPLYVEQKLNASMLTEDIGVAVRPSVSPKTGLVERAEVEKVVRLVMEEEEGKVLRDRVRYIKDCLKRFR